MYYVMLQRQRSVYKCDKTLFFYLKMTAECYITRWVVMVHFGSEKLRKSWKINFLCPGTAMIFKYFLCHRKLFWSLKRSFPVPVTKFNHYSFTKLHQFHIPFYFELSNKQHILPNCVVINAVLHLPYGCGSSYIWTFVECIGNLCYLLLTKGQNVPMFSLRFKSGLLRLIINMHYHHASRWHH